MLKEFKEFLTKRNAMALAIGVIIGAATSKLVTGVVTDLLMPVISLVLPAGDWREKDFALKSSVDAAGKITATSLKYGDLAGAILDFLIIATMVFFLTKALLPKPAQRPRQCCVPIAWKPFPPRREDAERAGRWWDSGSRSIVPIMKIYGIIPLLLFACFLQACQNNSTAGEGGLLSDGYISWTTDGLPFIVHDSITAGDPGENLLYGSYQDSTLSFNANLPYEATSHFPPRAEFLIAHCRDTGIYVFSTVESDNEHSFAEMYDYPEQSDFVTDSSLEGELHLTRLDIVTGRIAGTFAFTARRFNGTDTIRVGNGVVFDFPITVFKN